jgi:5-methyltetrahydrofolate--homocysteine methyltransferase
LFEMPSVDSALAELSAARSVLADTGLKAGVLLAASADALRSFDEAASNLDAWVVRALELAGAGARVIGGGAGTTEAHTRTLTKALGVLHPSLPPGQSREAC